MVSIQVLRAEVADHLNSQPCRQRKMKCDEAKPICGLCRKAKRACVPSEVSLFRPQQLPIAADVMQDAQPIADTSPNLNIHTTRESKHKAFGYIVN